MKPAEAVAALGIAVQSKVNVEFMKETVIVMKNVRVLLPVELEIVQYICFRRMRTVAKNQVINQMSLKNLLKSIGYFKK